MSTYLNSRAGHNLIAAAIAALAVNPAYAHHGGVSAAFGPGAAIETSSPLTLPAGKFLIFERVEISPFEKFNDARDIGGNDKFTFTNTMFGLGLRDDLSLYMSIPYAKKELINDTTSQGFGDLNFILQYGFKYGARDGIKDWYSLDGDDTNGKEHTLKEWKFGISAGMTLPSGDINNTDSTGATYSVGTQTGFAVASYNVTGIVSKMFLPHWTWAADVQFRTFELNGGSGGGKPGNEMRVNNALIYEIFEKKGGAVSRVDLVGEVNYLHLDKDMDENRISDDATGGDMIYLSPGVRISFKDKYSLGMLYKNVVTKSLNNEDQQQGGEGLEDYRFITTLSAVF
ncbi:MAG: Uncharacterized protein FD165_203 [Gammaproteobacteria bacterium]|nr:MAG: Uncharacterized protein FD165_203 [Gammaproteobacteria bacterium]TND06781.1 MAG: Uncharacterized protein FD120_513 [Gammaproteobacteria bacterium]